MLKFSAIQKHFLGSVMLIVIWGGIPFSLAMVNRAWGWPIINSIYSLVVGSVLFAIGAIVALWCVTMHLRTGRSTPLAIIDHPMNLLAWGPYKYSRNPMYLAVVINLAGLGLFWGYVLLLVYPFILLLAYHLFVVYIEEPELRKIFGKAYLDYCRKTPRWVWKC